jgi:hypothetical protein
VLVLGTSRELMLIPVTGPAGVDLTAYVVEIALVADPGGEPSDGDYHPATWIAAGMASLMVGSGGGIAYSPGEYMAYVRVTAGAERPVQMSGRVRVGDARG